MKLKKNKGFTLVELIIAMSIFTVVTGLGYRILNKTSFAMNDQKNVSANQLNVNLINKYVTKDLEGCKKLKGPDDENVEADYEFIINEGYDPIKYIVSITSKGSKEYYSLTRKNKDSEIDLVVNQPKVSKTPFFIKEKEGKDNLFTVQVDNVKESSGQYTFEVSSRLVESSNETPNPPIETPDEEFEKNHKVTFWINESLSNANNVNIGVSHPRDKYGNLYKKENTFSKSKNNRYEMYMNISLKNSGNQDMMGLSNDKGNSVGGDRFQTDNLDDIEIDCIIIEVGNDTKFEMIVNSSFEVPNTSLGRTVLLEPGIYKYKIKEDVMSVKGAIIKEGQNSVLNIYYGKIKY